MKEGQAIWAEIKENRQEITYFASEWPSLKDIVNAIY